MKHQDMVELWVFETGKYTTKNISPDHTIQMLYGCKGGENAIVYHCPKSKISTYVEKAKMQMIQEIEDEIAELTQKRAAVESIVFRQEAEE